MWVEKVILQNIKNFESIELRFTLPDKHPCKWITLLGENGVGKSTILQSLGLLLAGPEAAKELLPRATGWARRLAMQGQMEITIHQDDDDAGFLGKEKRTTRFSYAYTVTGEKPTEVDEQIYTEPIIVEKSSRNLNWLRTKAFASSGQNGWLSVGYGAFRRLTRANQITIPSLEIPTRSSNFFTQFNEDRALSSFERWLVYLDFQQAKNPHDDKARQMREVGERVITQLLPGNVSIAEVTSTGTVLFDIDGRKVPAIGLSDGFRSMIALAGDLIWRLLQAYPDHNDPTKASGVVLIDELDIHLHPSWQREIAGWLREVFPNIQFIVATHSPLVAISAGSDALTLKLEMVDGNVSIEQEVDLSAYDVDRVLRSPAFDMSSTFSPQTQEKIERYHDLLQRQRTLSSVEQQEFQELAKFMREARPLNPPATPGSLEAKIEAFLQEKLS